jgi:hypothetical protein
MGGACSTNGEERNTYRLLMGMSERKRLLGRPRRRWVDNIGMDLVEVELVFLVLVSLRQNFPLCWKPFGQFCIIRFLTPILVRH